MSGFTRRSFLKVMAAIPIYLSAGNLVSVAATTARVRYDVRSSNGQAMLKLYAKAVKAMKSLPEGDPRSWMFQWYTHQVNGTITKSDEITRIYPVASAWRALANDMWDTCQTHGGGNQDLFLPWHRMFIYFFEDIVRSMSGDESFTLPYWNYSTTDLATRGILPDEFRRKDDPVFGSLYVDNRNQGVNDGQPIQGNIQPGNPRDPLNLSSLAICSYSLRPPQQGFCLHLDLNLHGNVHVRVGDTRNMGRVQWAANDPIFWLHHCNLDRLWASWNAGRRSNPNISQDFVFSDKDGNKVVRNTSAFMDLQQLDYSYDVLEPVPVCEPREARMREEKEVTRLAKVPEVAVRLGSEPVRILLDPVPMAEGGRRDLSERFAELPNENRVFLVLRNLRTDIQPGVLYELYLNLSSTEDPEKHAAHFVGTINFFEAETSRPKKEMEEGLSNRYYSFDITDVARRLGTVSRHEQSSSITFVPAGKAIKASQPSIGEIEIVAN